MDQERIRNFAILSSGVVRNCGDTMRTSKGSGSQSSLSSDHSSEPDNTHNPLSATASGGSEVSDDMSNTYKILLLGGEGVGKTALTQQFLTSDDIAEDDDYYGKIHMAV